MSKSGFWSGLLPVLAGVVLVVGVTALQGLWTERWTGRNVAADLKQAAEKLEEIGRAHV